MPLENNELFLAICGLLRILLLMRVKESRHRSIGVRPIFRERPHMGDGTQLLRELRNDSQMFFNCTRLNYERFEYLLRLVGPHLKKQKNMKTVISPEQRLAMTLRYLAVGDTQASLSFAYRCGRATVSVIIRETLRAIVRVLIRRVLIIPTTYEEWEEVAQGFEVQWQLSLCCGAIDGRHVHIQAPKASGSTYFNYKKTFSTNLMAVAAADYSFLAKCRG